MTRIWWRLVFLLSILNIILFVFHFAILFLSFDDNQCDSLATEKNEKPIDAGQLMKQQSSSDIQLKRYVTVLSRYITVAVVK